MLFGPGRTHTRPSGFKLPICGDKIIEDDAPTTGLSLDPTSVGGRDGLGVEAICGLCGEEI